MWVLTRVLNHVNDAKSGAGSPGRPRHDARHRRKVRGRVVSDATEEPVMDHQAAAGVLDVTVCQAALSSLRACALLDGAGIRFGEDALQPVCEACRLRAINEVLASTVHTLVVGDRGADTVADAWWALDVTCSHLIRNHHTPLRASLEALSRSLEMVSRS